MMYQCSKTVIVAEFIKGPLTCMRCGGTSMDALAPRTQRQCANCRCKSVRRFNVFHRQEIEINPLTGKPWPYDTECVPLEQALEDARSA